MTFKTLLNAGSRSLSTGSGLLSLAVNDVQPLGGLEPLGAALGDGNSCIALLSAGEQYELAEVTYTSATDSLTRRTISTLERVGGVWQRGTTMPINFATGPNIRAVDTESMAAVMSLGLDAGLGNVTANSLTLPKGDVQTQIDQNKSLDEIVGMAPSLDLNFDAADALPLAADMSRASTATYVGADGLIKTAVNDELRIDHDPLTLEPKGALIEGQRTNLLLQSEDFSASHWVTVTGTATLTPNLLDPAGKIQTVLFEDTDTSLPSLLRQSVIIPDDNTTYTASVFVKEGTTGKASVRMAIVGGLTPTFFTVDFDFATETFSPALSNLGFKKYADGWYRLETTLQNNSTGNTSFDFRVGASSVGAETGTVLICFPQLEQGSFATSYIPTTTAQATRVADTLGLNTTTWARAEGTVFVDAEMAITTPENRVVFGFSDGAFNNSLYVVKQLNDSVFKLIALDAGLEQVNFVLGTQTNQKAKLAFRFGQNDFAGSVDGNVVAADTSGSVPNTVNCRIGGAPWGGSVTSPMNGHIKRLAYFPKRLSDTILMELTK